MATYSVSETRPLTVVMYLPSRPTPVVQSKRIRSDSDESYQFQFPDPGFHTDEPDSRAMSDNPYQFDDSRHRAFSSTSHYTPVSRSSMDGMWVPADYPFPTKDNQSVSLQYGQAFDSRGASMSTGSRAPGDDTPATFGLAYRTNKVKAGLPPPESATDTGPNRSATLNRSSGM
jgi:hypothetical protein